MGCVSADSLQGFLDGSLTPAALGAVELHLDGCTACRELLVESARTESTRDESRAGVAAADAELELLAGDAIRYGSVQVGRYPLGRLLGAGGMGVVYAAHDPQLQRQVAIKLLHAPRAAGSDEAAIDARLLDEARAMARLSHPNVLPVFEVGESLGRIFLVMELAGRGSLADLLERRAAALAASPSGSRATSELPGDRDELLELFIGAGRGLAAAHAAGLVHRDFKPANVLLGDDGRPRVTDFGLARPLLSSSPALDEALRSTPDLRAAPRVDSARDESARVDPHVDGAARASPRRAPQSTPAGSPAYMAPEQLRGAPLDPRADLFSFCVSLYEALYGERPFEGASVAALLRSIDAGRIRAAPPGSRVPMGLRAVLTRGLQAEPAHRFDSMEELLLALETARHPMRRRVALAFLTAMLLAGIALALTLVRQEARLNQLAEEKSQLDASIARVLAQLDAERDPRKLASLDDQLGALSSTAASEDPGPPPGADALDLQLRALLEKFGAGTYAVPPAFKERLREHIQRLLASPTLREQWQRKALYFDRLTPPFRALGLPEEMVYLAWAESRFDPAARSETGALGLWQFMPDTARRFGLAVDGQLDQRTDVDRSSVAAAHYLAQLMAELGSDSFLLAIASYNAGEDRMRAALAELAKEPGGFRKDQRDFWHLYLRKLLPQETREYVLEVLAAILVGTNAQAYGLELPPRR